MSSMSLRKPIVVCLYVWTSNALSRMTSKSFSIGFALFLLYSPRTARASVLNSDSPYSRFWKRSASIFSIVSRSSFGNVVW